MPAFRRGPWRRVGLGRAAGQPYTIVQGCRIAGSTGRRNTGVKSLCWGFKLQGLTWSFV